MRYAPLTQIKLANGWSIIGYCSMPNWLPSISKIVWAAPRETHMKLVRSWLLAAAVGLAGIVSAQAPTFAQTPAASSSSEVSKPTVVNKDTRAFGGGKKTLGRG
jgi:hypothetical protein